MNNFHPQVIFVLAIFMLLNIIGVNSLNAQRNKPSALTVKEASLTYDDMIYSSEIKSVQLYKEGWELSYPVIAFNSNEKIVLSFDDLNAGAKTYSYTIIHCTSDWQPSGLFQAEYIEGFYQNHITEYFSSFNTFIKYTNYRLVIPNEEMKPKYSGNYLLKVFENYDEKQVVLTRRFYVCENTVSIIGRIKRPVLTKFQDCCQEILFSIFHPNFPVYSPMTDLKVVVNQNNRKDIALTGLKPLFIKTDELVYENQTTQVFPGGNEFRNFDIKSMRYQSEFIRSISFEHPNYYIDLTTSKPRNNSRYFFDNDLNGNFVIQVQEGVRNNTDADYTVVIFRLDSPLPFENGDVYVTGRFNSWGLEPLNKMEYNYEEKAYELSMLLKQGYYNYQYTFVDRKTSVQDTGVIEGNFYETENDYYIYVYFREPGSRYDRLIAYEKINVLRK